MAMRAIRGMGEYKKNLKLNKWICKWQKYIILNEQVEVRGKLQNYQECKVNVIYQLCKLWSTYMTLIVKYMSLLCG